ncbi:hypothetical protein [Kaistia sp. MMO-174]|uniref:hypothetical protein n=1 Tax=Kaistia sp. MMO-174 TaxID=3081256 RepID=UPI003016464E
MTSPAKPVPADGRDTLWLAIGITILWLSCGSVLLLTAAKILSTAIEWVKS